MEVIRKAPAPVNHEGHVKYEIKKTPEAIKMIVANIENKLQKKHRKAYKEFFKQ